MKPRIGQILTDDLVQSQTQRTSREINSNDPWKETPGTPITVLAKTLGPKVNREVTERLRWMWGIKRVLGWRDQNRTVARYE